MEQGIDKEQPYELREGALGETPKPDDNEAFKSEKFKKTRRRGRRLLKFLSFMIGLIAVVVAGYQFIARPHVIVGAPLAPFSSGQVVWSETVTLMLKEPQIGEVVIAQVGEDNLEYIGFIVSMEERDGNRYYKIQTGVNGNYEVEKSDVIRRIYYPRASQENKDKAVEMYKEWAGLITNEEVIEDVVATESAQASPSASSTPSATPKASTKPVVSPKPFPSSASTTRGILVIGVTFEDLNRDGKFVGESKLGNLPLYIYDSYDPNKQITTVYSDKDGKFSVATNIRGNLLVKPMPWNNYVPTVGTKEYSSDTNAAEIGFIASSQVSENTGEIEGEVFHDANRNGNKDAGESGVDFYTLYLVDDSGGYYNTWLNMQRTESNGRFKYTNLPLNRIYKVKLSNPTGAFVIDRPETPVSLSTNYPRSIGVYIPVFKN